MEYFRKIKLDRTKPWLIVGKGPTFKKIYKIQKDFNIFGLNHVAKIIDCDITHFIDIDVLDLDIIKHSKILLCPWHLHENSKIMWKTLPYHINNESFFSIADKKLYWYNCSTWKKSHYYPYYAPLQRVHVSDTIKVQFFSAEAAFQILGMLGVKKVYSLGIDGGVNYAKDFVKLLLAPFKNTRKTFDDQFQMIEATLKQFNMEWEKL